MRRTILTVVFVALTAMRVGSDVYCDNAYTGFLDRVSRSGDEVSGDELARLHRNALRIFAACDSGHMGDPERRYRELERAAQR